MTFATLGLSQPIIQAITELGYSTPTPIQVQAIPIVLKGRDLMASAQTGTGKTGGFVLPILERLPLFPKASANHASVLILAPTRELAAQIHASVLSYAKYMGHIRCAVVFGGVKINPQMMSLRPGVDILIATPGRLLDLYQQKAIALDTLHTLVLDEADRMLDMGFLPDIKKIVHYLPKSRQTLLFSATFSPDICQLAKVFLKNPLEISVTPRHVTALEISQWIHPVDKAQKSSLLAHLILEKQWSQVLVFSRTKHGANKLVKVLNGQGIDATAIHGNKSQAARTRALADFKQGKVQVLVATDIAARGIDIDQLPIVINVDLPQVPEDYIHRIGRTGRAGAVGSAISLVCADEIQQLMAIEKILKKTLDRIEVDGFTPDHHLPIFVKSSPQKPQSAGAKKTNFAAKKRYYPSRHKSS